MFGWLRLHFGSNGHDAYDVYKPSKRLIYRYWDGSKMVPADPLRLWKRIAEKGAELSIDIKVAESESKDAIKAHDAVVRKIRDVFGLKPLEEGGLSETESMDLLNNFLIYCEWLKKNSSQFRTSPNSSAGSGKHSDAGLPTSNSLDSGSTANEPSTVEPEPSPVVQA